MNRKSFLTRHLSLKLSKSKSNDDLKFKPQLSERTEMDDSKSTFYTNDTFFANNEKIKESKKKMYHKSFRGDNDLNQSKSKFYYQSRITKIIDENKTHDLDTFNENINTEAYAFRKTVNGEVFVAHLPTVKCTYSSIDFNDSNRCDEYFIKGKLVLTTFKLEFIPHDYETKNYAKCYNSKKQYFKYWNENEMPLTFIYGIYTLNDKSKKLTANDITTLNELKPKDIIIKCKNFSTKHFAFNNENFAVDKYGDFFKFLQTLLFYSQAQSIVFLPTYQMVDNNITYRISNKKSALVRQDSEQQRLKTYLNNTDFEEDLKESKCKSIMEIIIVPKTTFALPYILPKMFLENLESLLSIKPIELIRDNRLPLWSFTYENGCSVVMINESSPINKNFDNEILKIYNSLLSQAQRFLEDNNKIGEEFEEEYIKIQVPFISSKVGASFERLIEICAYRTTNEFIDDDDEWNTRLHNTKWLKYINLSLHYTKKIIHNLIYKRTNVFIEEKYPKDISCILTSLTKIFLNKKNRSIIGFENLIQKEWFLVGHMFNKRLNLVNSGKYTETPYLNAIGVNVLLPGNTSSLNPSIYSVDTNIDNNNSANDNDFRPIFLLFLDCVHQLVSQCPNEFEFNQDYLIALYDYCLAGVSPTFTFNGIDDLFNYRYDFKNEQNPTYFDYLIDLNWNWNSHLNIQNPEKTIFYNNSFDKSTSNSILQVSEQICDLKFWVNCYLRWYNLGFEEKLTINNTDSKKPSIDELASNATKSVAQIVDNYNSRGEQTISQYAGYSEFSQNKQFFENIQKEKKGQAGNANLKNKTLQYSPTDVSNTLTTSV